jgi:hypothetical protein
VPISNAISSAPSPGSSTFTVHSTVKLPPASGTFFQLLQATHVYTLYTVGFDVLPPIITPTMASGATLSALPEVLADAADTHAGVDAEDGVVVRLGGQPVEVRYDTVNRRIVVPEGSRAIPPGLSGPADLVMIVTDGFCNRTQVTVPLRLDASAPPTDTPTPTQTPTPSATWTATATATATVTGASTATPSATGPTSTAPTPTPTVGDGTPDPRPQKIYLPFAVQRKLPWR